MSVVTDCSPWLQERCKTGEALLRRLDRWEDVSSAELQVYEVKARSFCVLLRDFSQRVELAKRNIDKAVRLYEFFDKVRALRSLVLRSNPHEGRHFIQESYSPKDWVTFFFFGVDVAHLKSGIITQQCCRITGWKGLNALWL